MDELGLRVQVVERAEDVPQDELQELLGQLPSVAKSEERHEHRFVHEALERLRRRGPGGVGGLSLTLRVGLRRRGLWVVAGRWWQRELEVVEESANERPAGVPVSFTCPREAVEMLESGELASDRERVPGADLDGHVAMFSANDRCQ